MCIQNSGKTMQNLSLFYISYFGLSFFVPQFPSECGMMAEKRA